VEQASQQAIVADTHDDDWTSKTDDKRENVPEKLVSQGGTSWPADLAAVACSVHVGVQPDRKHDDGADDPRRDTSDYGVARCAVAARS